MKSIYSVLTGFLLLISFSFYSCSDDEKVGPVTYKANFIPINNSGVSGSAILVLEGNVLTVKINAIGLEPNQVHPQHIYGFGSSVENSTCPPPQGDLDDDGTISVSEGEFFYGTSKLKLEDFPNPNSNSITYEKTFTLGAEGNPPLKDIDPLEFKAVVIHGLTVEGTYNEDLPVACGHIVLDN